MKRRRQHQSRDEFEIPQHVCSSLADFFLGHLSAGQRAIASGLLYAWSRAPPLPAPAPAFFTI
jgi:ABC-type nitrate/sulfonate/bicarbonate transport system permease component